MKSKIVSEKTGQPIGFGMSIVRELIYQTASPAVSLARRPVPAVDPKRQTLADKSSTIALPI